MGACRLGAGLRSARRSMSKSSISSCWPSDGASPMVPAAGEGRSARLRRETSTGFAISAARISTLSPSGSDHTTNLLSGDDMRKKQSWKPWHEVVRLRDDVRTGELSLTEFAADLHDVMMQKGKRPVYEDPGRFFALTYPTLPLRELARDVAFRLAGQNTKAIRQLELTYGGGKTHTLVTLRHLMHAPESLPALPAVKQFQSYIGMPLPASRVTALCFDKLDVEKGMEVRGPEGKLRWLKHPWSVLAFQIAGETGLRTLHPEDANEERETPPAEPLLASVLEFPQKRNLATLVLLDEVLMYVREKAEMGEGWPTRLIDFFQYLCQAAAKVDRCALVASLLASDPAKSDEVGKELTRRIFDIFNRQREAGVEPVQKQDVAEVLRRRFFEFDSIANPEVFRPHATAAAANVTEVGQSGRKDIVITEKRFLDSYPFHPDLTDIFYTKWTQLEGFQRTRGILRTFAAALRDAEKWDKAPLIGAEVFLSAPDEDSVSEAARDLAGIATREVTDGPGNNWSAVLEGELSKARAVQSEHPMKFREIEQAVCAVFLSSQPIGQKAHTPELMSLIGTAGPDRIQLEKGLRRWTEISWFLDETEFAGHARADRSLGVLPNAWRLGNRPNLIQMHHDACGNRVTAERVDDVLLDEIRRTRYLTQGAAAAGAIVHMLPERARDIADDARFHFAVLGPGAVSDSGKPSAEAKRFINETTGSDRPRVHRNAIVLAVPSRDGLDVVRKRIREHLGWLEVRSQLEGQEPDPSREGMLNVRMEAARKCVPDTIRQAWTIVVTVNNLNDIQAFSVTVGAEPLFLTVKGDRRARIQETAVSPDALLPGGPYDLWRTDEQSRRVKDLAGAFAENPKLPKMLRPEEIRNTINQGVRDGIFVASLVRPDKSTKTWWRTQIDEAAITEPALELFLPGSATLSELDPGILAPDAVPGLWNGGQVAVADIVAYFAGGRIVAVQRDGYEETISIPACPRSAVDAAVSESVGQGIVWLVNGPAGFQKEPLPAGALTDTAVIRTPMQPLTVDRLMRDAVPSAWNDGRTSALALSTALSAEMGAPLPWPVLRQAIDSAINAHWLQLTRNSGPWPCDFSGAAGITLKEPDARKPPGPGGGEERESAFTASADLEPNELQDFTEVLPDILKAATGSTVRFHMRIVLEDEGSGVLPEQVSSLDELLAHVNPGLRLRR